MWVKTSWSNIGANNFSGPSNFAVGGVDPSDIVAADFNLDGDLDLATVNTDSNNVSVLAGDGLGGFGVASQFSVGTAPGHVNTGDFDGNGSKDLVTANNGSSNVSVLINQNTAWTDLGFGLAGTHGIPNLSGTGVLEAGAKVSLNLSGALENTPTLFVGGVSRIDVPFRGGTFVPALDLLFILPTSPTGSWNLNLTWPEDVQSGLSLFFQIWLEDPVGVQGASASNALETITQ